MTNTRLLLLGLGNICLNQVMICLLYRWQLSCRRVADHNLCCEARDLCQQVGKIEEKLVRKEEVLS